MDDLRWREKNHAHLMQIHIQINATLEATQKLPKLNADNPTLLIQRTLLLPKYIHLQTP
jgi:hypothetical protein